jgi:two-component system sensor histidine kinase UhpB
VTPIKRLVTVSRQRSLYARVVAINAAIVAGATVVLMLTPATVGYPISWTEAAVLVVGVVLVIAANAAVLRVGFGGLNRIVTQMETVDLLQPKERLPLVGDPETRAVVAGLNQMLSRLERERRESSQRTLAALEDERRRIARELHDEIGQRLTGLVLQLGMLTRDSPPELRDRIRVLQENARATLDEVAVLAWQLRPGILDDLGLRRALEALVESLEEQTPQIRIEHSLPTAFPRLAPDADLAIYRIAQEAITNAVRHSGATRVELAIAVNARVVSVSVSDDGTGLGDDGGDVGIRGMRERAISVGGTLTITSGTSGGALVVFEFPRDPDNAG